MEQNYQYKAHSPPVVNDVYKAHSPVVNDVYKAHSPVINEVMFM